MLSSNGITKLEFEQFLSMLKPETTELGIVNNVIFGEALGDAYPEIFGNKSPLPDHLK